MSGTPFGHWITELLNKVLGAPVAAGLGAVGIQVKDSHHPIPEHVATEIFIFLVAVIFFLWLRPRLSVDRPGGLQQCMEGLLTNPMNVGIRDLLYDIVGHGGERYMAMLGSIGVFVLLCNLVSLVPGFESPTAKTSVPLGCAIAVFAYYNFCGVHKHGPLGYGKHFLGPSPALAPLMLLIEVVSHLARLLSLTVRLWVNMMVSEMLYSIFLVLTLSLFVFTKGLNPVGYATGVLPLVAPVAFIVLHVFVGFLQAFVFTILPIIYVSGAVAEEH